MTDFGTTLFWTDDVDPTHRTVSGTLAVGQALYRRLRTPRGQLIDDPDYGFDILGALSKGFTTARVGELENEIAQECLKDERVASVKVVLEQVSFGVWRISITGDAAAGPFRLVLAAADVTLAILEAA